MKFYRKKPEVVQAVQFINTLENFENEIKKLSADITWNVTLHPEDNRLLLPVEDGTLVAYPGDWVVKDGDGNVSICKRNMFEKLYELA